MKWYNFFAEKVSLEFENIFENTNSKESEIKAKIKDAFDFEEEFSMDGVEVKDWNYIKENCALIIKCRLGTNDWDSQYLVSIWDKDSQAKLGEFDFQPNRYCPMTGYIIFCEGFMKIIRSAFI